MTTPESAFVVERPRLVRLAYRMLGSLGDAEDVVQEAWLRFHTVTEEIHSPSSYLTTVVTRLCIDRMRVLSQSRKHYEGTWLPEPVLTDHAPEEKRELAESLRLGFLVLLESLNPVERAVFLLREVFDYDYDEIAAIVEKSEANCRQIFTRAKTHLRAGRPQVPNPSAQRQEVAGAFLSALMAQDVALLQSMLKTDAKAYSDHGGKVRAARKSIVGADRVARFLCGLARKADPRLTAVPCSVNSDPGLRIVDEQGHTTILMALEVDETTMQVSAVYFVLNPEKLSALGKVPGPSA